jgi:hypothetical protein
LSSVSTVVSRAQRTSRSGFRLRASRFGGQESRILRTTAAQPEQQRADDDAADDGGEREGAGEPQRADQHVNRGRLVMLRLDEFDDDRRLRG